MNLRSIVALLCCSAVLGAAPPPAPSPTASPSPAAAPNEAGILPDSVTDHSVTIGGTPYAYSARAGTLVLTNAKAQPAAAVFYTAYTVSGADRPVTFVYNGGPGSSTMWLRMGSFGPVRVVAGNGRPSGPPPYRIEDNPYSLLDKTDLVFIDMPDSGFGRIIGAGTPKEFFGVDQDVAAFGQFIERYISKFGRWNSPKFIFGESYGTTRSAALSDYLLQHGVTLNGVILQSSILNFALDYGNGEPNATGDWPYVFYLPTEAATAWYHGKIRSRPADIGTFLNQVETFATGEYLEALYKGNRLDARERDAVAAKLSRYLGIPENYVLESNIRVPYDRFQRELLRGQGVVVGRLDSRYTTYGLHEASNEGPPWDPTDSSIDGPYTDAVNEYIREDLKYNPPIPYRANIYDIIEKSGGWDDSHNQRYPTNVAPDLADAMTQNPDLKLFSANGYYDFATPFFATMYTLQHLELARPLQQNITYGFYQAGHMIYLDPASLAQYKSDLARWYDSALRR
jgi:carboxypeptidase C (cathepsin A)